MTSNVGARELQSKDIGFAAHYSKTSQTSTLNAKVQKAMQRIFNPEFINRLDAIVTFNPLEQKDVLKVVEIHLAQLQARAAALGYTLELTHKAKEFLAAEGHDPQYGVRPLKRAIQQYLEDALTAKVLAGEVQTGDTIQVKHRKDSPALDLSVKKTAQPIPLSAH